MAASVCRAAAFLFLLFLPGAAQRPSAFLKNQKGVSGSSAPAVAARSRSAGRAHFIAQFPEAPGARERALLERGGFRVLQYFPPNGWVVSGPAAAGPVARLAEDTGVTLDSFDPSAKISPDITENEQYFLVEFFPDVDMTDARQIIISENLQVIENAGLAPNHLLAEGRVDSIRALVAWDEVAYVIPAADDLLDGSPVYACAGPLTDQGQVGLYLVLVGDGWAGPSHGAASLTYAFNTLTDKIPADQVRSEILRAMNEWAKVAKVSYQETTDLSAPRSVTFLFASKDHGDGFPFDGPGGVLAHTFYPAPPNAEPIAGDMHFDADEAWRVGADIDLYTVALHEMGHALGLGHSDKTSAVMYPYYRRGLALSDEDKNAILSLYAAQDNAPADPTTPTSPAPPAAARLVIALSTTPAAHTTSSTLALAGTVSGGTGDVLVTWSNTAGGAGTAQGTRVWTVASIALALGANTITITATDAAQASAVQVIQVTRDAPPAATPVQIRITTPATNPAVVASTPATLAGTAAHASGIQQVAWSTAQGAGGQASGTTNWSASVPLAEGTNSVTVTATAGDGTQATAFLTLTYTKPSSPDHTPPTLVITDPASNTVSTTSSSITITGTASDNVGVAQVVWSNSTGTSGTASGTSNWQAGPIPLLVGTNMIIVRAKDAAGNSAWRSVSVTRLR